VLTDAAGGTPLSEKAERVAALSTRMGEGFSSLGVSC
jgi:hypothetical protein